MRIYKILVPLCSRWLPAVGLMLLGAPAQSQRQQVPTWNAQLEHIAYAPESAGWYRFKPGAVKTGARFFKEYKTAFGLGPADSMHLTRTHKDVGGRLHYRFQQYFNGIPVEGAEFLLHEKDGEATSGNGSLVSGMRATGKPALSETQAQARALDVIAAPAYLEKAGSSRLLNRNVYRPRATLVYQRTSADLPHTPENLRLCYRFEVHTAAGDYVVYIDAVNGALVNKIPLQSECVPTNVGTNWYGLRTIRTTAHSSGYYLQDDCAAAQVKVLNNNGATGYSGSLYSQSTNTGWNATADLQSAATSLWATRQATNFYQSVFNRNGFDDAGGDISVYQNAGFGGGTSISYNNASMTFSGGLMKVGNNGTAAATDDWNTLDIIAHEFAHAVTGTTSQLVYQGESGALNESFSDIMGAYTEYWEGSGPFDWLIGEDRGAPFRSLQNPGLYGHPSTYKTSPNWYTGTADYGGVHLNSGVQNYWFYLLAQGGSGTNDNGIAYSVKGIGMADAAFITYITNAYYLTSDAQYVDARNQSIQVAIDYYGSCSAAALETAKAWYAVGVGGIQTLVTNNVVCGTYTASTGNVQFRGVDILPVSRSCTVTLNPAPNTYRFTASRSIILSPGFTALQGSTVHIYTDSCNITQNSYTATIANLQAASATSPVLPESGDKEVTELKAWPNPARHQVVLSFALAQKSSFALLELYDLEGRRVSTKSLGLLPAGKQQVSVQVSAFPAGAYMALIRTDGQVLRTRLVVTR